MSLLILLLAILSFAVTSEGFTNSPWSCKGIYINISIANNTNLSAMTFDVMYQYKICRECELILLTSLDGASKEVNLKFSNYDYVFEVVRRDTKEIICPRFEYTNFGECGLWRLDVADVNQCTFSTISKPLNTYIYLYIALALVVVVISIVNLVEKYPAKFKQMLSACSKDDDDADIPTESARLATDKEVSLISMKTIDGKEERHSSGEATAEKTSQKKRVESLDTFRGLSLILMIMVTYAWEGYPIIHHLPWHGINIGTLVFPWFLWIMGFSIPIAINSIARKPDANRLKIFLKIFIRTCKMFAIGLILNVSWGMDPRKLRIFGVLQRIGICYFFLATLELVFYKKIEVGKTSSSIRCFTSYFTHLIYSWKQSVVVLLLTIAWFLITFLLPVPGCPKGYFGPGGLEYNSTYFNCTGGAAGYIDRLILTENHMYLYSTPIEIYKNGFFDPEGILGILTSILLAYFGSQAGRVLIFHKNRRDQLAIWIIWVVLILGLFFGFTQGDMYNGWIPVNKNIWTFTFSLISAASALGILFVFYIVIDILKLWTGTPFKYPGKNSIVIYVCHYLFLLQFPVQWQVPPAHLSLLLKALYGVTFWILVAAYMFYKNVFINL